MKEFHLLIDGRLTPGASTMDVITIARDIPDTARLVREEQFGPVLSVISYTSIDEVLERANDSIYGLKSARNSMWKGWRSSLNDTWCT
jgi:acyl-CoA reductase-like NAD-dependent aldehyde dehydrogenase